MTDSDNSIIIYQSPDGRANLEVNLHGDSIWLS